MIKKDIEQIFRNNQSNFGEIDIDNCIDDIVKYIDNKSNIRLMNLSNVQLCPVCKGNGIVDNGFYNQTSGNWISSGTCTVQCRSCYGKGYVKY
jgi:hypothetical protein